jgi:hypothetical protein
MREISIVASIVLLFALCLVKNAIDSSVELA